MFTSIDYEKFRTLRITHVATRFEELIADEANDELTPEQLFLTAIDDALEQRRANRIAALIRTAGFPIPTATIAELDYREGRGINPTRMRRYAAHDWSAEPVNLLINSPTGGGKTYLACAIGIAACQNHTTSPTPAWTSWPASSSSPAATPSPISGCSTSCPTPTC